MSGKELNKIIAAILLASLVTMMTGFIANILYKPDLNVSLRGYSVQLSETTGKNNTQTESAPLDIPELMKTANAELGKEVAKKCLSCHSLDKDGPNKIGPHLWNVDGRAKASIEDYKYSPAMIAKGGVWDDASLFEFLSKPSKFVPGTKMSFIGLSKPQDVANMILFLKKYAHD